jgi:uridine kinase
LTIIHDSTTSPEDFIFYTDRLCSLVVEEALSLLPYKDREVTCNGTGRSWKGKALDVENVCSVSILRSGSVFEKATRRAIPDLAQGSLLIQSDETDGEPQLYFLNLPLSIRRRSRAVNCHALLLDAQVSTGAAAFMAIRVLLDHGVPQQNIIFLSVIASARGGLWALTKAVSMHCAKAHIILARD